MVHPQRGWEIFSGKPKFSIIKTRNLQFPKLQKNSYHCFLHFFLFQSPFFISHFSPKFPSLQLSHKSVNPFSLLFFSFSSLTKKLTTQKKSTKKNNQNFLFRKPFFRWCFGVVANVRRYGTFFKIIWAVHVEVLDCSRPFRMETETMGKMNWGTWEELILGSAVRRHGTRDWNVVASELRARTLYPHCFTPEVYTYLQLRATVLFFLW